MMKHILRKLHIGGSNEGFDGRNQVVGGLNSNDQDSSVTSTSTGLSGWLSNARHSRRPSSSSTASTPRQQRVDQSSAGGHDSPSSDPPVNFNYYEEEYQVQLALALSVSNQNTLDDPESLQIRAAKRISLGRPPSPGSTPGESTAHRYWNYNVLDYEEKVVDGFYDVYGVVSDFGNAEKLPSLVDLQSTPLTSSLGYEVVLVNRAIDPDLVQLEQAALCLSVDWGMTGISFQSSGLVQKIAELVVQHMGGPVLDANEMHSRWVAKSFELRTSLNNIVLPLGCLKIGLSRHRALLFKVLADHVGISCRLVKGSHYTGTDEGAVNIIKLDSEREYIVDLMGAPGTLLPAEAVGGAPNVDASENGTLVAEFTPLIERTWNVLITDKEAQFGPNSSSKETNCFLTPTNGYQGKDLIFLPTEVKTTLQHPMCSSEVDAMSLPSVPSGNDDLASTKAKNKIDGSHPVQLNPEIKVTKDFSRCHAEIQMQENTHGSLNSGYMECWKKHVNNKGDPVLENVAEWEIPWDEIVLGERIGLGSYGEVHHGDWHGTEVAVKRFLDQDFFGDALDEFISEVQIMRRMQHPNVVLFLGAVTRPPNLSIVTEFLPRGSLFRLLHRPNNQLDEKLRLKMAIDVAEGMNYLHTSKPIIVHRDLKSPNLLVDKNWVVKVCDFGLSRMKHHTFLSSKSTAGTPEWMAPEVLRNELSNEKCDVYSFGVILWELCTLQQPWSGMNPMQVVGAVGFQNRRLEIPKNVDPDVAKIISSCWQSEPRLRPSFSELTISLKPLERLLIVES